MEEKLTKKLVKELMSVEGECRGVTLKTDKDFILRKKGGKGLIKVEAALKKVGQLLKYREVEPMAFYPIGLRALSLVAIQDAFGFSNEEIEEMGRTAPKVSFVIKLFAKFFFSIKRTAAQTPKMWEKHYTVGRLEAEIDEKKKEAIVRLKEFDIHPLLCIYLNGYFATIIQMVVNKSVTSKEIKCSFKDKAYKQHEYLLRW